MEFELIEPINTLFKDEVRKLGIELGIPEHLVWRQPFPGPGLGIRVLGEITEDKLEIVRESDAILRQVIREEGLERNLAILHSVTKHSISRCYGRLPYV